MSIKILLTASANYNSWANKKIIQWLEIYPEEWLHTKLDSSYPTIQLTFKHIIAAEVFWLNILQGNQVEFKNIVTNLENKTLADYSKISTQFSNFVEQLPEESFLINCELNASWVKANRPKYEFIQHCMNHSTYHRGQIITMGRTLGMQQPPNTDFNTFTIPIDSL